MSSQKTLIKTKSSKQHLLTFIDTIGALIPAILSIFYAFSHSGASVETKIGIVCIGITVAVFLFRLNSKINCIDQALSSAGLHGLASCKSTDDLTQIIKYMLADAPANKPLYLMQYSSRNVFEVLKCAMHAKRAVTLFIQHPDLAIDRQDIRLTAAINDIVDFRKGHKPDTSEPEIFQVKVPISVRMVYVPGIFIAYSSYLYIDDKRSEQQAQAQGEGYAEAKQSNGLMHPFDVVGHENPCILIPHSHESWPDWEQFALRLCDLYRDNSDKIILK